MRKFALVVVLGLAGCSQEPRARSITGPDGSAMVHVSCGSDQSACFELAGKSCPTGYRLFPIFDAHDNNFLVRCEAGRNGELLANPFSTPARASRIPAVLAPPEPSMRAPTDATAWSTESTPPSLARSGGASDLGTDWGY
jgi:hypothetical protein